MIIRTDWFYLYFLFKQFRQNEVVSLKKNVEFGKNLRLSFEW